ncbi:hypothetical protein ACVMIX_004354 [Rhizobium leguminosarum]
MRVALCLALTWALSAGAVSAGQVDFLLTRMLGTIQVRSEPYMVRGKLSGCQYVFSALAQDWVYRKGQYLKVDGSIAIMFMDGNFGSTLKVVVNEVLPSADGTLTFSPSPPSRAYLIGSDYQTNLSGLVSALQSDTPGALFSIFNLDPTLKVLTDAGKTNKVTVAFNRDSGASDILLPLELDVKSSSEEGQRVRTQETGISFANCVLALLKDEK